jgi:hypothetical protein
MDSLPFEIVVYIKSAKSPIRTELTDRLVKLIAALALSSQPRLFSTEKE